MVTRRLHLVIKLLMIISLCSSCYRIKPLHKPIDKTISKEKPDQVQLILQDDSEVTLHHPKVIDDSIIGINILPGTDSTTSDTLQGIIPLESVKKGYLKTNKHSGSRIIVAVACSAVIVFILSNNRTYKGFTMGGKIPFL